MLVLLCLTVTHTLTTAQFRKNRFREKGVQLSLVPGISTNGIHSAWYFNKFSLNLFSGISAGSKHFALAGVSNASLFTSTGIQIAGISNVVGTNSFINLRLGEEREAIKEELNKPLFHGIQLAGVVNLVRNNVYGFQFAGGVNLSYGALIGLQIAGLGNVAFRELLGVQLAGLYNVASQSVAGMQVALVANITRGPLAGSQIGIFNSNAGMPGKRTNPPTRTRSLQVGLVNVSKNMAGLQVGLINVAKEMSGTQIGILNFLSTAPVKSASQNGLPLALLNFGSKGHFTRFSYNDQFAFNIERSTGNCANCSDTKHELPLHDRYQKFNQNSLIISYNPGSRRESFGHWAFGWRYERLMYIKHTMFPRRHGPQNGAHFLSWGAGVQHINWSEAVSPELSLVTSIQGSYGRRFNLLGSRYWYITARLNSHFYQDPGFAWEAPLLLLQDNGNTLKYMIWLGYSIGIQV